MGFSQALRAPKVSPIVLISRPDRRMSYQKAWEDKSEADKAHILKCTCKSVEQGQSTKKKKGTKTRQQTTIRKEPPFFVWNKGRLLQQAETLLNQAPFSRVIKGTLAKGNSIAVMGQSQLALFSRFRNTQIKGGHDLKLTLLCCDSRSTVTKGSLLV